MAHFDTETLESLLYSFDEIKDSSDNNFIPLLSLERSEVQTLYKKYLSEKKLDTFSLLLRLSKILPDERIIQSSYDVYMRDADIESIEALRKTSGIVPNISFSAIQNGYSTCNENCIKGLSIHSYKEKAYEIFKRTKVKPVEKYSYLKDICN